MTKLIEKRYTEVVRGVERYHHGCRLGGCKFWIFSHKPDAKWRFRHEGLGQDITLDSKAECIRLANLIEGDRV